MDGYFYREFPLEDGQRADVYELLTGTARLSIAPDVDNRSWYDDGW